MANMILRLPAVKTRTGLSRSTIYLRVAEGRFPKPISLGARAVGWVDAEVEAWLSGQIEQCRRTPEGRSGVLEVRW
jgi:prophage regulatory protein